MRNIKLTIQFDGTNYAGWQRQTHRITVQAVLEENLKKILGEEIRLHHCGRTDAGAHAFGHVSNFLTINPLPTPAIQAALNSLLPPDIILRDAREVERDFDSRRTAKSKIYHYYLMNNHLPSAFFHRYCWFIPCALDLDLMQEASSYLVGKKDFSSFRASGCSSLHPFRRVLEVGFKEGGIFPPTLCFYMEAEAFLRHMVRIIVGTLAEVGRGRIDVEDFKEIIEARDRRKAGMTAPARGLFLVEVKY